MNSVRTQKITAHTLTVEVCCVVSDEYKLVRISEF